MKLCLTGLGLGSAALGQSTLYYKATILSWHRYQSRDNELRHRWELLITQLPAPSQDTGVPWCDHWPSPDHHQVSSDKMQSDRSRNLEEILLFCVCEWSEEESKCHQDAGECSLSLRHIRNVRNILHIRSSLFSRGEEENCEVFFLSQSLNITQHKFCAAPEVRQAPLKQFCWQRNIICDANFHPGLKRNVISGLSPLPACWTLWHVMF